MQVYKIWLLGFLMLTVYCHNVNGQQRFLASGNYFVKNIVIPADQGQPPAIYKRQLTGESFNVEADNLAAGKIVIQLSFMETEYTRPGQRGIAIFANGKLLDPNLDVFEETGSKFKPLIKRYDFDLTSARLGIVLNGVGVNAILNEVKVFDVGGRLIAVGDAGMQRDRITLGDSRSRSFSIVEPDEVPFYNVDHSPIGAFSTFIYGMEASGGVQMSPGTRAGIGDLVPHNGIILAVKVGGKIKVMPFSSQASPLLPGSSYINAGEVKHHLDAATDSWQAPMGLNWKHYMPYWPLPEIEKATATQLKKFVLPATWMVFSLDNTKGKEKMQVLLSLKQNDAQAHSWGDYTGYSIEKNTAIAVQKNEVTLITAAQAKSDFGMDGATSAMVMTVPAGKRKNINMIVAHYMADNFSMVGGEALAYYFTNYYKNIGDVILKAAGLREEAKSESEKLNKQLAGSTQSKERKFQVAHSLQSYRFNTVLFKTLNTNKPFWGVTEGEYAYVNTFDLTVDHVFLELALHPWTVRNELDLFTKYFSYTDSVRYPGSSERYAGGIGFTHDMGAGLKIMPGQAEYGQPMTQEELQNWILCAGLYVNKTNDLNWLKRNQKTLVQCLRSMQVRDDVDSAKRDGITSMVSCTGKYDHDITTYDAMDKSLQQVSNSMYISVKSFACYLVFKKLFTLLRDKNLSAECGNTAALTARSIVSNWDEKQQCFPAIFKEQSASKIIPAVEGLIYPYMMGMKQEVSLNGPYSELIGKLKTHLQTILKPGICIDPKTEGWFLSTTSNTTWQSKVFLSQYIAENVLGIKDARTGGTIDKAEYGFQVLGVPAVGWSDQIRHSNGTGYGGRHYPRGVTSALWWLY